MLDDGSFAMFILSAEVKGFRDSGFFISSIAPEELLFVGSLVIDKLFGIDELVSCEKFDLSDSEAASPRVDFLDVRLVIDESSVYIGS